MRNSIEKLNVLTAILDENYVYKLFQNFIIMSLLANLSEFVGAGEPALRLLFAIFAGYPLALIYRKLIYGKNPTIQHLYFIIAGFILGFSNYGVDIFHAFFAIFTTYFMISALGGTTATVIIVFIFNLVYLLAGYYCSGTDNYDINWTMPQCVLVLRLIGVTFDIFDGQKPIEKLSEENKKTALKDCPPILDFFGYMLFPGSFMVGPQFSMRRYQDFVNGKFDDYKSSIGASIQRFALGILYLILFQIFGTFFVSDEYMISNDFGQLNIVKKFILMGIWGRFTLYKYISCWLLTEGVCILFGVSYNGKDENGNTKWDGVANINLKIFENTTQFTHYIQSFNINTNHWIGQYIYKRLKFLGNRHISQLAALLFLAIWHGFHSGYYVCFLFEFAVVYMERDIKSIVNGNDQLRAFFSIYYVQIILHILLRIYTFVFMGWCLLPFALFSFERYWKAFGNVYHAGTLLFIFWPIIYSPILRLLYKKSKNIKKDD